MQYRIEVEKRAELDGFLKASLIEKDVGTVAEITTHRPDEKPDPDHGIYALEWHDEQAGQRFTEYAASLESPVLEEALAMGLKISSEYAEILYRDGLISNLMDIANIHYYKELAENNTLYRLPNDPEDKVRIAPNPDDRRMQEALDLVFGKGAAVILNDTLPEDPEAYVGI